MAKKQANKAKKKTAGAPSAVAMGRARTLVLRVLKARFGDLKFPDNMKLSKLGLNSVNLPGIAQNIRDQGVPVNNAPIQICGTVLCIIKAVAHVQG